VRIFAAKLKTKLGRKHENDSKHLVVAQLGIKIVAGYEAIACVVIQIKRLVGNATGLFSVERNQQETII